MKKKMKIQQHALLVLWQINKLMKILNTEILGNSKKLAYSKASGFTLIEVLVAMSIMALIGVGALKAFDAATVSTDHIKQEGKRLNDLQRAFMFISNDIQQVTTRIVRDEFGDPRPVLMSDLQSSVPFFRFTRLGRRNPAQISRSNLEHLIYSLEDKKLYRTSFIYSDGMPDDSGLKRELLDSVEDMKVSFFDGNDWHDSWPAPGGSINVNPNTASSGNLTNSPILPVAIKLKLEFTDYGEIERFYSVSN